MKTLNIGLIIMMLSCPCFAAKTTKLDQLQQKTETCEKSKPCPSNVVMKGVSFCFNTRPPVVAMNWLHKKILAYNKDNPYMN